jgi:hypothetical protein
MVVSHRGSLVSRLFGLPRRHSCGGVVVAGLCTLAATVQNVVVVAGLCHSCGAAAFKFKNPLLLYRIIHFSTGDTSAVVFASSMPGRLRAFVVVVVVAGDPSAHSCYLVGRSRRLLRAYSLFVSPESPLSHRWMPTECSLLLSLETPPCAFVVRSSDTTAC